MQQRFICVSTGMYIKQECQQEKIPLVGLVKKPRIVMITYCMPVYVLDLHNIYHLIYSSQWSYEACNFIIPTLQKES